MTSYLESIENPNRLVTGAAYDLDFNHIGSMVSGANFYIGTSCYSVDVALEVPSEYGEPAKACLSLVKLEEGGETPELVTSDRLNLLEFFNTPVFDKSSDLDQPIAVPFSPFDEMLSSAFDEYVALDVPQLLNVWSNSRYDESLPYGSRFNGSELEFHNLKSGEKLVFDFDTLYHIREGKKAHQYSMNVDKDQNGRDRYNFEAQTNLFELMRPLQGVLTSAYMMRAIVTDWLRKEVEGA